jgi:hypothetical protein
MSSEEQPIFPSRRITLSIAEIEYNTFTFIHEI